MEIDKRKLLTACNKKAPFYDIDSPEKRMAPQKYNEDVVLKNLEKLKGRLMMRESMGGTAGSWPEHGSNRHSCYTINFYFNRDTGEIDFFSNSPLGDGTIESEKLSRAYLKWVASIKDGEFIVKGGFHEATTPSLEAIANLRATACGYNRVALMSEERKAS